MICADGGDWKRRVCSHGCALEFWPGHVCEDQIEAHHVITQQSLRKHGLKEHRWNTDNGMALCYKAHRRHTLAVERVPYEALPEAAIRFAFEHGLDYQLDRFYPRMEVLG